MTRYLSSQKGLTLVEVILAISILGIMSVIFLNLFSTNFKHIFSIGEGNRALHRSANNIELLLAIDNLDNSGIISNLEGKNGNHISDLNNIHLKAAGKDFNFFIEEETMIDDIERFKVTIIHFYWGGENYVTLTSLVGGN